MAAVTLAKAQEMYDKYLAAEMAILEGQSYSIGNRTLTRANLSAVVKQREAWGRQVQALKGGGSIRVRRALFRDL